MSATTGAARAADENASSMKPASLNLSAMRWSKRRRSTRMRGFIRRASSATSMLPRSSLVAMTMARA
jgi:hypothetical protein